MAARTSCNPTNCTGAPVQLVGLQLVSPLYLHSLFHSPVSGTIYFRHSYLKLSYLQLSYFRHRYVTINQSLNKFLLCLPLNRHVECQLSTFWLQSSINSKYQSGPDRTHTQTEPCFSRSAVCSTINKRRLIYRSFDYRITNLKTCTVKAEIFLQAWICAGLPWEKSSFVWAQAVRCVVYVDYRVQIQW